MPSPIPVIIERANDLSELELRIWRAYLRVFIEMRFAVCEFELRMDPVAKDDRFEGWTYSEHFLRGALADARYYAKSARAEVA